MSPPVVMLFIWSLERGGAERQVSELLFGLDRSRFEPVLVTAVARDDYGASALAPHVSLGAEAGFDARSFARLVAAMRARRPALVHSWMGSMNWYARHAAWMARVPRVIGSVRARRLDAADMLRERVSKWLVDRVIVNSAGIRDELIRRARIDPARIDMIENGVDLARFAPLDPRAREERRSALGWHHVRVLVHLGHVGQAKNQLALAEALRALYASGELPGDLRVVSVGRVVDVAYAARVRAALDAALPRGVFVWHGPSSQPEQLLAAADALLLPSPSEGLSNAVVEAMACGTPVIVSPLANLDALVRDGREGITLRGHDPGSIAAGLRRFFALDRDAREAMGREARAHAEGRFSNVRMVARTMDSYDRALAGR